MSFPITPRDRPTKYSQEMTSGKSTHSDKWLSNYVVWIAWEDNDFKQLSLAKSFVCVRTKGECEAAGDGCYEVPA